MSGPNRGTSRSKAFANRSRRARSRSRSGRTSSTSPSATLSREILARGLSIFSPAYIPASPLEEHVDVFPEDLDIPIEPVLSRVAEDAIGESYHGFLDAARHPADPAHDATNDRRVEQAVIRL